MAAILYVGNFDPEHSTENHVRRALINNGHEVWFMQENDPMTFEMLARGEWGSEIEFILWTRTGWDWSRIYTGGEKQALIDQRTFLRRAHNSGVPTVGYHLDIWWGLKRQPQIFTEPYFEVDLLVTADGGHEQEWREAGIMHHWMPPGVSRDEAMVGCYKPVFASDIAFVGSWHGGYHPESEHRHALVNWLRRNHPKCEFWPKPGAPAVRGKHLQDLYRSAKIAIGDSCFTGTGLENYWSDRIPETLGRGGLLLHPDVPGLEDYFTDGVDLLTWEAFDFDALGGLIEQILGDNTRNEEIRRHGRKTVLAYHTYETRMEQLMDVLHERNLL